MKKLLTMLLCLAMAFTCAFGAAACTPEDDKDDTGIVTPGGDDQTPGGDDQTPGGSEQPGGDEQPEPEPEPSDGLKLVLNDDNASYTVASLGSCTDTDVVIPSKHNGLPVTSIGYGAFSGCSSLASIVIPDSVTEIGYEAFQYCHSLTSIVIPDSVTSIGDLAFSDTAYYNDESNWENGVLYIGKYLIEADSSLSGEYIIKAGTKVIAHSAFSYCDLTSIVIPDSVTSIGSSAFFGCSSLASVTIGDSVTSIGIWAFSGCGGLTSITVDPDNSVYHSSGNCLIETDSKTLIAGCSTSVIPADGSVTSIGERAFYDCEELTSIVIPDTVTSIGDWAFSGTAYYNDESNWENGVLYIGNHLIKADSPLSGEYIIKAGTKVIAHSAFQYRYNLTNITIPDSVTSISDYAFDGCWSLTSVTIGDSATSIGYAAFSGCSRLTSIVIPDSVTSIGEDAFEGCINLANVTIGDSVTSIGSSAFRGCSSLTSITIPDSVTTIGAQAFASCYDLTSIVIPDSITSIGDWAFDDCINLTTVYYTGSEAEWKQIVIGSDNDNLLDAEIVFDYKGK